MLVVGYRLVTTKVTTSNLNAHRLCALNHKRYVGPKTVSIFLLGLIDELM